jgi:hypothetical protein
LVVVYKGKEMDNKSFFNSEKRIYGCAKAGCVFTLLLGCFYASILFSPPAEAEYVPITPEARALYR